LGFTIVKVHHAGKSSAEMRQTSFSVAVVGRGWGSWKWIHKRMGWRTAGITMLGALRPRSTSHIVDEHGECHMAQPVHSPKHVVREAEYVGCLLIVSTELKFDVPPL